MAKKITVGTVFMPQQAKQNVLQVLKSKRLSYGPFCEQFEQRFSQIHQVKYSLLTNSGTSALQVALHALKMHFHWQNNDEILVPALTFVATVNVVLQNNLKPIFVDVDPNYFDIDIAQIEKQITKKTRALIVAHLFGQSAPMDKIMNLARKYKLKVIEDSCETMFSQYQSRIVGSWGEISCFSTYSAHLVTTGIGGVICTNNSSLAKLCRSLINHGRSSEYFKPEHSHVTGRKLEKVVKSRFAFLYSGYSYRLGELEAALGLAQLAPFAKIIKIRQKNAQYLTQKLEPLKLHLQTPQIRPQATHDFMVYPLILKNPKHKLSTLLNYLEKAAIETRELLPLLNQPVYRSLKIKKQNYPVANKLIKQGFYIGCHQDLEKADVDYVISVFKKFFE